MSNESKASTELTSETPASNLLSSDSIQVKNVALVILTTLAVVFALDWAQSFIVTMLLGVLLAYVQLQQPLEWRLICNLIRY